ncbi:MAG: Exo-glucosaminidase LytG precursor [Candidatus Accumulibacter sp. BA-94]|uniref:glucosaminidase domain-containing protein n=1 Tax=Accumulibacter sp. TaxID=2053492 RepID=UPI000445E625|nr:glucosaminidase domain-containing protein [Accumulibacter sp.]EXI85741.1 MAG: Exo-glucosaminidase LytG precursor [Candidatus Accumulibacter sp. BA-94]HRD89168.1 glucosaminidase domain-containing protein [Accumulibacter sp.]
MKVRDFIDLITPGAQALPKVTGVPASFTVGEATVESEWGASQLARQGKNLFGVRADPP